MTEENQNDNESVLRLFNKKDLSYFHFSFSHFQIQL